MARAKPNISWIKASICLLAGVSGVLSVSGSAQDAGADADAAVSDPCKLKFGRASDVQFRGKRSQGYEASQGGGHTEAGRIEVRHAGEACAFKVTITPEGGRSSGRLTSERDGLEFRLLPDQNTQASGAIGELEMTGRFGGIGGAEFAQFRVEVLPGQQVAAGQFSGVVEAVLFQDRDGILEYADRTRFRIVTDVWPRVSASIGSHAGAGIKSKTINFGKISSGAQQSLIFSVNANAPYQVSLKSEQGGGFKHQFSEARIPYTLLLDGSHLSSDQITEGITVGQGRLSQSHNLQLKVGRVSANQPAGAYSDRLTVVISAD